MFFSPYPVRIKEGETQHSASLQLEEANKASDIVNSSSS